MKSFITKYSALGNVSLFKIVCQNMTNELKQIK